MVTQQHQEPRQLVVLSAAGAHILTSLRPVDQLQFLIQESAGPDGASVKEFFAAMSPTQACATALILAVDPNTQNAQVNTGQLIVFPNSYFNLFAHGGG